MADSPFDAAQSGAALHSLLDTFVQESQSETAELRARLAATVSERDEARASLERSQAAIATLGARVEELGNEADEWRDRANVLHGDVAEARQTNEELRVETEKLAAHNEKLEETCVQHEEALGVNKETIEAQAERNRTLHSEIVELYADLRAEDLPSLIMRIGLKLTGSEAGIFADATGSRALSIIGLEDAKPEIMEGIFEHARKALQSNEPIVVNESSALPDGAGLVNLAALPVTVQGDSRGVILIANKRSGPYDSEDTELLLSIGNHAGIAIENRQLHCALGEAYISTVAVLADAIEAKDPYTRGHCQSVSDVASEVGKRLGWNSADIDTIRYAALLHDVGKIGVPDGILLKPGRLLPEEFSIIQKHAAIGSDLVKRVPALSHIAPVILHHHERIDGSGYPDGQAGEEIAVAARIIGIVDSFDAMTSTRPYREPVSRAEAIEELRRGAGTQYDGDLVDIVADILAERAVENETPLT